MISVCLFILALIILPVIVILSFKSYRDYFRRKKANHSTVKALALTVIEGLVDIIMWGL